MNIEEEHAQPSPFISGLKGACPLCGQGNIFAGFLALSPRCGHCGLDFSFADSGDGPAVFVTLIGGFLVLGAAFWTELRYEPPLWVHLVIFLPLTLLVCLCLLRPLKGLLIALQYRNKAGRGHLEG